PVLRDVGSVSNCLLHRRSLLLAKSVRVCSSDRTERAGSIVRFARVPSISRRQDSRWHRWMAAGCFCPRARSAAPGNNVVDLCSGSIDRADRIDRVPSLHPCPRSRSAQFIGKMAWPDRNFAAVFPEKKGKNTDATRLIIHEASSKQPCLWFALLVSTPGSCPAIF